MALSKADEHAMTKIKLTSTLFNKHFPAINSNITRFCQATSKDVLTIISIYLQWNCQISKDKDSAWIRCYLQIADVGIPAFYFVRLLLNTADMVPK